MNKIEVQKKFDEINDQLDILHAIFEKFNAVNIQNIDKKEADVFRQKILKLEEESSLYFKKLCYSIPRQNK
ncbi:hypothetical protein HPQ32_04615 [Photobacterium carnosum]|jgi:hypothetical protein|uniref:hypothetical protein n=1 Tax=Photobacterium carnosum TaxID=2023717 RepID=UPI001C912842|nr:hypothetical protein [Photobacterium carnosum]MBY3787725.1 hypothetical protein [Photobacterium carnosum]MCD9532355.1 hypothetical protein [Photobacterium carnosum]